MATSVAAPFFLDQSASSSIGRSLSGLAHLFRQFGVLHADIAEKDRGAHLALHGLALTPFDPISTVPFRQIQTPVRNVRQIGEGRRVGLRLHHANADRRLQHLAGLVEQAQLTDAGAKAFGDNGPVSLRYDRKEDRELLSSKAAEQRSVAQLRAYRVGERLQILSPPA